MKTDKKFDAVRMMRDIRDKHHAKYEENPQLREKRLQKIREKYKDRMKKQKWGSHK